MLLLSGFRDRSGKNGENLKIRNEKCFLALFIFLGLSGKIRKQFRHQLDAIRKPTPFWPD